MDAIDEKCDPLSTTAPESPIASSVGTTTNSQPHLVAATNIVQLTIPQGQAQVGFAVPTLRFHLFHYFFLHFGALGI